MKKKLPIIILLALVTIGGATFFVVRGKKGQPTEENQQQEKEKKRITEPVNQIPVKERPYMQIKPVSGGRHIIIAVNSLKKPADQLEYELEYQSGEQIKGAFDQIDLSQVPVEHKKMLGTCSAGGACTYHEDVKGGSLLGRFSSTEDKYVLKSDWRYLDNTNRETKISSRDAKFKLNSESLADQRYLIVYNSPGYPQGLDKEPISNFYALSASNELNGEGELTIRANEENEQATIVGYNGTEWVEFESQIDGKEVTAQVELMPLYLVKK